MKNKKVCCYFLGLFDLICFVGGAYLLSAAIFGSCGTDTICNCGVLGLPLIVLGLVVHCWIKCCCCCGKDSKCCSSKTESETPVS